MSNNLSELQKKYMMGIPLEVSRTHELNVKAAIKKKIVDFDYFLINFLMYPNANEFYQYLVMLYSRLSEYMEKMKSE